MKSKISFRILHSGELFWSYILPALITLTLDIRVILTTPPNFASNLEKHRRGSSKKKKIIGLDLVKKVLRIKIGKVSNVSRKASGIFEFKISSIHKINFQSPP